MKKILLVLAATMLFSCVSQEDKAVAKVGKEKITQAQFDVELAKMTKAMVPADYTLTEEESKLFNSQILNNMIQKIVFTKRLDELDIQADDAAIDDQFTKIQQQYPSEEEMLADIEARGFTIDELRKEFIYQFRVQELNKMATESDIEIPAVEVKAYYEEHKDTIFVVQGAVNSCSHILFKTDETSKEQALTDITAVREKIIAGMNFNDAAVEFSQGPSGPNGGQLGGFQRGQMVKEFEDVAFNIALNEVSQPVLTQFGYHLILVEDRTEENTAPFEETKDFISAQLKKEKFFEEIENSMKVTKPEWAKVEA